MAIALLKSEAWSDFLFASYINVRPVETQASPLRRCISQRLSIRLLLLSLSAPLGLVVSRYATTREKHDPGYTRANLSTTT